MRRATKREIIASVSIVAIMLLAGILISGEIAEHQMDRNEVYNKAVKIETTDLFEYGMRTNVGNAFVYGDLETVDPVAYPEIDGQYMYVEKVKERYTMHTRQVSHTTTVNGQTHTYYTTETYWTWDRIGSENIMSKQLRFCGIAIASNKVEIPLAQYVCTINESGFVRYVYYGTSTNHTGTIFTELKNNTILDRSPFYENYSIDETVERLESNALIIVFWVAWIIFMVACVAGFYYVDNRWLEQ